MGEGAVMRVLERVLRDDDDATGQTVRSWRLTRDGDHIQIAKNEHSDWSLIRVDDVAQLIADLREIAHLPAPPETR